ncbi:MAG: AMP-binding protein, partial [Caulobacterales bacterium]|nr:AMP-binding protein [Caulobacterales bacterium]
IVAIASPNSLTHAFLTYALPLIDCIPAPFTPAYSLKASDPRRLKGAISVLGAKAIFFEGENFNRAIEWLQNDDLIIITKNIKNGANSLDAIENQEFDGNHAINQIDPQSLCKILLTSGSTGVPKAVAITHFNLSQNAAQIRSTFDPVKEAKIWPDGIVMINHLPWSHSLGGNAILHMITHSGATLWIDEGSPTIEGLPKTIEAIKLVKPNYHNTVPLGWSLLASAMENDDELAQALFENAVILQYGGAALTNDLYERIQKLAMKHCNDTISFAAGYGATETGPTACNIHWPNTIMGLVGLPVPGVVMKLLPHNDKLEARVKGPAITPYYLNNIEKTKEAFDEEGYYILGDALAFYDINNPKIGLKFNGRLSEEFKMLNGSFVQVSAIRLGLINICEGLVSDAIICGEGREELGALLFLNQANCQKLINEKQELIELSQNPTIISTLKNYLKNFFQGKSATQKITNFAILPSPPSLEEGEITDKGYLNQGRCREFRADFVEAIYNKKAINIFEE